MCGLTCSVRSTSCICWAMRATFNATLNMLHFLSLWSTGQPRLAHFDHLQLAGKRQTQTHGLGPVNGIFLWKAKQQIDRP